jgi:microcystin-dependent protein
MADQFIGEIRLFAHGVAPGDWMVCDGQLLKITKETTVLFSIIGNRFGGDGMKNFALPNLNGRAPGGVGKGADLSDRALAATDGYAAVLVNVEHYPMHSHTLYGTTASANLKAAAGGHSLAAATAGSSERPPAYNAYATETEHTEHMGSESLSTFGASFIDRHNNMQPYLSLQYCIAIQGAFPPRPEE